MLAQFLLVIFIWGAIGTLAIRLQPIPDPLLDAGFIIIGFYFRATMQARIDRITSDKIQQGQLGGDENERTDQSP